MKILLLLLIPCVSLGRVGEKYADFVQRVATPPVREKTYHNGFIEATYRVNDILVLVEVGNGVISKEIYAPVDINQSQALVDKLQPGLKPRKVGSFILWLSPGKFRASFTENVLEITDGKAADLADKARKDDKAREEREAVKKVSPF